MDHFFGNRELFIESINQNLLTSTDAANLLNVSKQRLGVIARKHNLQTALKTTQGKFYFRSDILDILRNGTNIANIKTSPIIFDTDSNIYNAVTELEKHKNKLDEIVQILVYHHRLDALLDGFYTICEDDLDIKKRILSPRFVIRDINGQELWFNGFACGNEGIVTTITTKVIESLGVDAQLAKKITTNTKSIQFIKENKNKFNVILNKENIINTHCYSTVPLYLNNRIIFLQDEQKLFNHLDDLTNTLNHYYSIVPNIKEIVLLKSKESALSIGYSRFNEEGHKTIYQIILRDQSNKELWLPLANPSLQDSFYYSSTLKQVFIYSGIPIRENEKLPTHLTTWLKSFARIIATDLNKNAVL
ncbi:hypothetical protein CN931_23895 [Bacillus sp. AFS054943]|uniref:Uncharacterized protein n=1 Tax=Bacillus cereus TaxID=1396 RepID=A0A2C1L4Q8_BACCE|nr:MULTISPECIES: hypothetical protein [Bacillus]PGL78059.1 hypothetical protein CN931_23895 [Bacillus sp. AFS054943]PGT99845.1 hypothetical protein COD19_18095 [Bacillus cereus]